MLIIAKVYLILIDTYVAQLLSQKTAHLEQLWWSLLAVWLNFYISLKYLLKEQ